MVGLLQQGARLLQGVLVGVALAVGRDEGIVSLLSLELGLGIPQRQLVGLDVPLGLSVGSVGMLKVAVKVKHITLKLLLHPESLSLALGLSLNSRLHALEGLAHVLLGAGKLLLLLGNPPLNLLPHLGQLKLGAQDLVLLLLQSSLGLRQGSLKLHLLSIQTLADFVNLVDGAATLADLVHDVLDLIGEVLVLPPDLIQLDHSLLIGRLHAEELRGSIAGLLLCRVEVHANGVHLLLPLTNNPVELPGLLLHCTVQDLSLVQSLGLSLKLSSELVLRLLKLGELSPQLLSSRVSFRETSLHLQLGHLKLLSLSNTLLLVPHTKHISLTKSL